MKKFFAFFLAATLLSSFAYGDMMYSLTSSSFIVTMLDNEIEKGTDKENSNNTDDPNSVPINEDIDSSVQDEENIIEDPMNENDSSEDITENEDPLNLDPTNENNLKEEEIQSTVPAEDKGGKEDNPVESNDYTISKPKYNIIHTLNKKNAWSHKTVYLTFDDGPSPITDKVLDILKKEEVKATFFVIGTKSDEGKATLKRISNEGHSIGNHSYGHNYNYIYKSVDNFFDDLYKNEEVIYEATGIRPKIIRFPGGSNNATTKTEKGKKTMKEIMDKLDEQGYVHFDWNASSGDASVHPATVDEIINNSLTWISRKDNAVILFHDTAAKTNTLKALPTIIEKLKFLGCNFEILTTSSPQIAFVKSNKNSKNHTEPEIIDAISDEEVKSVEVIISDKLHNRKPPHVIRKLLRLEREMEEMFLESNKSFKE